MKIEFNIAMMALMAIWSKYKDTNAKYELYEEMSLFTDFCNKYDLLDKEKYDALDEVACTLLRSEMGRIITVTNLVEYAKEQKNND